MFNSIFNTILKVLKIYISFTALINDWKNNKTWLINKLRNNFSTREKLCLNNTSTLLHSHRTLKFYFFRNLNALKKSLFISECSRCDCVQTYNVTMIMNTWRQVINISVSWHCRVFTLRILFRESYDLMLLRSAVLHSSPLSASRALM